MNIVNWLAFTLMMVLMVLFPIGLAIFFNRRFSVSWVVFFIAAGFYLINFVVQQPFLFAWGSLFAKMPLIVLLLTTLTYGASEETMRYLSFRVGSTMRANRTANGALMAGVGHGGTESIVFAIYTVLGFLVALLMPQALKASGASASTMLIAPWSPWWLFILYGFSRILGIATHLAFATIIVLSYRRSWLFYPLAILVHFVVDFTSFGALNSGPLWGTLVFALWAVAALFLIVRIRRTNLVAAEERVEIVSPSLASSSKQTTSYI